MAAPLVPGNFSCEIVGGVKASGYCPGDVFTWKLIANNASFYDPVYGETEFSCQVRGSQFGAGGISRPSGARGFIDNCNLAQNGVH